ncbi:LysR family transcriptional regulator [Nocardia sp. SYP-A9097]|uniref:LysR family transcriptional regulator n=1 Tax=Nocardia sp. SYP-A9097 TaxID=2663237 RepID=UPI00129B3EA2|nr:LysR family transcriptional regulator [Nocardia sp. SYP-A9097]MRH91251.1 LysR family transcriptional regulator [Nocardia sp. SYP-A9097]
MADPLDLTHLRTLVTIADTGGFRRAADALHLSQPSVSQHIRLLERRLKLPLLEKDGRGSHFTADGQRLLVEARALLSVHDEMLARFMPAEHQRISVGSTEHSADGLLPELLAVLREAYPQTYLHFRIDRSTALTDSVLKGALDFAVVLGGNGDPVGSEVGELGLRWVAGPRWQLPRLPEPISLVAFEEPCGLRQRAVQRLTELGYQVSVTAESGNLDGVLAAAKAGLGIALLPFHTAVPEGVTEVSALPAMGSIDVRLVARRGLAHDIERTAIDAITAHYRSMTGRRLRGVA